MRQLVGIACDYAKIELTPKERTSLIEELCERFERGIKTRESMQAAADHAYDVLKRIKDRNEELALGGITVMERKFQPIEDEL